MNDSDHSTVASLLLSQTSIGQVPTDGTLVATTTPFSQVGTSLVPQSLTVEFAVHGLMIPTLGLMGILGNVGILIVLNKRCMRNNINCLLLGLASIDITLIVCALVLFTLPALLDYAKVCTLLVLC